MSLFRLLFLLSSVFFLLLAPPVPPLPFAHCTSSNPVVLGTGSSLAFRLLNDTLFAYSLQQAYAASSSFLPLYYYATGSGTGRKDLITSLVDFADTDVPYSYASDDLPAAPDTVAFPILAASVVMIYNLPEIGNTPLIMDLYTIADIYTGNLTYWNDTRLQVLNPSIAHLLPGAPLVPIGRSDNSGTSTVFCATLAEISPVIAAGNAAHTNCYNDGGGSHWSFPVVRYNLNEGVADGVAATLYGIAYSVLNYATERGLPYAYLYNSQGQLVTPSADALVFPMLYYVASQLGIPSSPQVAATQGFNIYNSPSQAAWPIATFSYMSLRVNTTRNGTSCAQRNSLVNWLLWILSSPTAAALANNDGFAIPSVEFQDSTGILSLLQQGVICSDGTPAYLYNNDNDNAGEISTIIGEGMHTPLRMFSILVAAYEVFNETSLVSTETYSLYNNYNGVSGISAIAALMNTYSVDSSINNQPQYAAVSPSILPSSTFSSAGGSGTIDLNTYFPLPFVALPIVIVIYPTIFTGSPQIFIDLSTLALIYTGYVTHWNDTLIQYMNQHIHPSLFPYSPISVIVSAGQDGIVETTAILVKTLLTMSAPFQHCYSANIRGYDAQGGTEYNAYEWNWNSIFNVPTTVQSSPWSQYCGSPSFIFATQESHIQGQTAVTPNALGYCSMTSSIESSILDILISTPPTTNSLSSTPPSSFVSPTLANFLLATPVQNINSSVLSGFSYTLNQAQPDLSPCILSQLIARYGADSIQATFEYSRGEFYDGTILNEYENIDLNMYFSELNFIRDGDTGISPYLESLLGPVNAYGIPLIDDNPINNDQNLACYPIQSLIYLIVPRQFSSATAGGALCPYAVPSATYLSFLFSGGASSAASAAATVSSTATTDSSILFTMLGSLGGYFIPSSLQSTPTSPVSLSSFSRYFLDSQSCDNNLLAYESDQAFVLTKGVTILSLVISIIVGVVVVISMVIVYMYKDTRIIKTSSSFFLELQLFGLLLFIIALPITVAPTSWLSFSTCNVSLWLTSMGVAFAFVPLLVKTYRIYRIFTLGGTSLRMIKLSNQTLAMYIGGAISINIILLSIWASNSDSAFQPVDHQETLIDPITGREYMFHTTYCGLLPQANYVYLGLEAGFISLVLIAGCVLSISVRSVDNEFNESKLIATNIYNFSLSIVVLIPTMLTNISNGVVVYSCLLIFFAWCAASSYFITFAPKIWLLHPLISYHFSKFIKKKYHKVKKLYARYIHGNLCRHTHRSLLPTAKVVPVPAPESPTAVTSPHAVPAPAPKVPFILQCCDCISFWFCCCCRNPFGFFWKTPTPPVSKIVNDDGTDGVDGAKDPTEMDPTKFGEQSNPESHFSNRIASRGEFNFIPEEDLDLLNFNFLVNYEQVLEQYHRIVKNKLNTKKLSISTISPAAIGAALQLQAQQQQQQVTGVAKPTLSIGQALRERQLLSPSPVGGMSPLTASPYGQDRQRFSGKGKGTSSVKKKSYGGGSIDNRAFGFDPISPSSGTHEGGANNMTPITNNNNIANNSNSPPQTTKNALNTNINNSPLNNIAVISPKSRPPPGNPNSGSSTVTATTTTADPNQNIFTFPNSRTNTAEIKTGSSDRRLLQGGNGGGKEIELIGGSTPQDDETDIVINPLGVSKGSFFVPTPHGRENQSMSPSRHSALASSPSPVTNTNNNNDGLGDSTASNPNYNRAITPNAKGKPIRQALPGAIEGDE